MLACVGFFLLAAASESTMVGYETVVPWFVLLAVCSSCAPRQFGGGWAHLEMARRQIPLADQGSCVDNLVQVDMNVDMQVDRREPAHVKRNQARAKARAARQAAGEVCGRREVEEWEGLPTALHGVPVRRLVTGAR